MNGDAADCRYRGGYQEIFAITTDRQRVPAVAQDKSAARSDAGMLYDFDIRSRIKLQQALNIDAGPVLYQNVNLQHHEALAAGNRLQDGIGLRRGVLGREAFEGRVEGRPDLFWPIVGACSR